MQFVAYYPNEDDATILRGRVQAELGVWTTHFELDYASSASTVIYLTVIKTIDDSSILRLASALWQVSDTIRPNILIKWGPEFLSPDVFELKKEGALLNFK